MTIFGFLTMFFFIVGFVGALESNKNITLQEGDDCKTTVDQEGICKNIFFCDLYLLTVNEGTKITSCTHEENVSLICCPKETTITKARKNCRTYNYLFRKFVSRIDIIWRSGEDYNLIYSNHMALLGHDNEQNTTQWECIGALISEKFVLTSAQCLHLRGPVSRVQFGLVDLKNKTSIGTLQEREVAHIHSHPNYKFPEVYADIGLIELKQPVVFSKGVIPICLPENDKYINDLNRGIQILKLGVNDTTIVYPGTSIENIEECSKMYPIGEILPQGVDNNTQICGEKKLSVCRNLVGPMHVLVGEELKYIIGIPSLKCKEGVEEDPILYTKVLPYVSWIESIVWPN